MSRKRTRNLSWTPGNGPGIRELVGGPSVLLPLSDIDETTRPHVLILSVDDAEFLGNNLVSLARIARTQAADAAYARYVASSSDEPGWADRSLSDG